MCIRDRASTGSTNLDNFNGSIKKLAIDCGYVPDEYTYMPITESIKKKIKQFVYEYHQANKTNSPKSSKLVLIDDEKLDKLLSYSNPRSANRKKVDKLVQNDHKSHFLMNCTDLEKSGAEMESHFTKEWDKK